MFDYLSGMGLVRIECGPDQARRVGHPTTEVAARCGVFAVFDARQNFFERVSGRHGSERSPAAATPP